MIDRILKDIKTTIVCLIIFITGAFLVAFNKATLTEFGAFIAVAFALFFSKDPNKKTKA